LKLGKNASDTCAVLLEAYGGKVMKKPSVILSGIKSSESVMRMWAHRTSEMLKKCGI
jgi:hypothetical protein